MNDSVFSNKYQQLTVIKYKLLVHIVNKKFFKKAKINLCTVQNYKRWDVANSKMHRIINSMFSTCKRFS